MEKNHIGNILGIVAEYNPFHNGHKFQIDYCKKNNNIDGVVAVISGNITQRGELSILDKWQKAEMALKGGVDLVIELPAYYSCNGGSIFSMGAMRILKLLGCINHISFGMEGDSLEKIQEIANYLTFENEEFSQIIKEKTGKGFSYGKSLELALEKTLGYQYSNLLTPNNILAIEYLKSINILNLQNKLENQWKPNIIYVNRDYVKHNSNFIEFSANFASGKSLRNYIFENAWKNDFVDLINALPLPDNTSHIIVSNINDLKINRNKKIFQMLKYRLLISSGNDRANIKENNYKKGKNPINSQGVLSEGIENLMKKHIRLNDYGEFIEKLLSKRYTRARIQRSIIHLLLEIENNYVQKDYIRILGFNEKGGEILNKVKKMKLNTAPIVTNVNKLDKTLRFDGNITIEDLKLDIKATDLYNTALEKDNYKNSDFIKKPVIIRDSN